MRSLYVFATLLRILIFAMISLYPAPLAAFDYPFTDPYAATVVETPPEYRAKLPTDLPTKIINLKIFPDRKIPEVFWYQHGLPCSLISQKHKAPLIFIVAGTGARYDSPKMLALQRVFYRAGFHVVSISSPTHMDFIINASGSMAPGHLEDDARDLYRVMQSALEKIADRISVSEFYLTGYSLGGIQSAYVARLDDDRHRFDFRKVLLINPPVSLYRSVTILDALLEENIPGGLNNFQAWLDEVMGHLSDLYKELGYFEFSGEYIYKVHRRYPRRDPFLPAIIGLSFRMSSANMIFTADVMNGGGFITPTHTEYAQSTSLTPYAMVACRTGFTDYFHQYLYPRLRSIDPSLTENELIDRLSLSHIEDYLRTTEKIGVLHNQDDIILGTGDIDWLRRVFGQRARIFPLGGHCGNLRHPEVVRFMTAFFTGKEG
jgi:pimeloyl-ACP methyl ester carboxylesterase